MAAAAREEFGREFCAFRVVAVAAGGDQVLWAVAATFCQRDHVVEGSGFGDGGLVGFLTPKAEPVGGGKEGLAISGSVVGAGGVSLAGAAEVCCRALPLSKDLQLKRVFPNPSKTSLCVRLLCRAVSRGDPMTLKTPAVEPARPSLVPWEVVKRPYRAALCAALRSGRQDFGLLVLWRAADTIMGAPANQTVAGQPVFFVLLLSELPGGLHKPAARAALESGGRWKWFWRTGFLRSLERSGLFWPGAVLTLPVETVFSMPVSAKGRLRLLLSALAAAL